MNLKPLEPSQYETLIHHYKHYPLEVHDLMLTNLLLWRKKHDIHTLELGGFLYFSYAVGPERALYFSEPVGDWNDEKSLKRSIDDLIVSCHEKKHALKLRHVSAKFLKLLKQLNYKIDAVALEEQFDYCYDTEALAHLTGNKYHKKKNHLNQFLNQYDDQFEFKTLTEDNAHLALDVSKDWCASNGCEDVYDLCHEYNGIKEILTHWSVYEKRGLEGLILMVNGFPAAMTFGEPMSSDMFLIHIEKANTQYPNAYAAINHAMAGKLLHRYKWINREQDMGIEGLRRAKRSYHPECLLEKYNVHFI